MSRRQIWLLSPLAVAGAGVVLGLFFGGGACPRRRPVQPVSVESHGVTLTRIAAPARSDMVKRDLTIGDWVLSSKQISIVVGGGSGEIGGQDRYGAIVDLSPGPSSEHRLQVIRTVVNLAGAPVAIRTTAVRSAPQSSGPRLEIEQATERHPLLLRTDLYVEPGRGYAHMVTEVVNDGRKRIRGVRIGQLVAWPGAATFAPRLGEVREPLTASAPWIAREGETVTYGLAFVGGAAEVDFRADRVGPTDQIVLSAPFDLGPGDRRVVRRLLIASREGLGKVAELAWVGSGRAVGRVTGKLKPATAWARIEAQHPDGRTVLAVRAAHSGEYEIPLPEGRYRLVLHSPGGEDEQDVTITAGATVQGELIPPLPGRLRFSATDASQKPLPARWLIRGIPPTPDPMFGADERATGAGNVVYSLTGEGSVDVPPGRYRVTATHGPEYSIDEHRVQISVKEGALVRARLDHVVPTYGWIAGDFHLHAAPSFDSSVPLDDRVTALVADGVEFAVPTDHNHVTDYSPSIDRVRAKSQLGSMPGVEITTTQWGHFNAYPLPPNAEPPPYTDVTAAQIFSHVRERAPEALIQVNHPRLADIGYFSRGHLNAASAKFGEVGFSFDFDVLEVLNGFELHKPDAIRGNLKEWFELLNKGLRYTATGNSDSHRLVGHWAGYPRTYVRVPEDLPGHVTAEQVVEAVRAGHAVVSSGPFVTCVVNGSAGPGDLAAAPGGDVTVEVSVRAPEWVDVTQAEVWANGKQVAIKKARPPRPAELARISWQLPLRFERDTWVVVIAYGTRTLENVIPGKPALPIGFTNPVFVDVDENGKFDVRRPAGTFSLEPEPASEPPPEEAATNRPDVETDPQAGGAASELPPPGGAQPGPTD